MPWCEPGANFRESEKSKSFFVQRMSFVPEILQQGRKPMGKILIELDLHRMCGTSVTGKSSSAEAAANAMAA